MSGVVFNFLRRVTMVVLLLGAPALAGAATEQGTPVFRNITVRNLTAMKCGSAGRIVGLAETPLRNLKLENVRIEAHQGFTIQNTVGLQFEKVSLNGKPLDAASFQPVRQASR